MDKISISKEYLIKRLNIGLPKRLSAIKTFGSKGTEEFARGQQELARTEQQHNLIIKGMIKKDAIDDLKSFAPVMHMVPDNRSDVWRELTKTLEIAKTPLEFYNPKELPKLKYRVKKKAEYIDKLSHSYLADLLIPTSFRELKDDWNYGKYVVEHKKHVYEAGRELGVPRLQLLKHDMSKFKPKQFVTYRDWFQGPKGVKGTNNKETYQAFRNSVDDHYNSSWNAGHHWRKHNLAPYQVPLQDRLESLADWYSVGKTNKFPNSDNFKQWYYSRRIHLPIDQQTKNEVERILSGPSN
jgi:hypothetical protein